MGRAPCCDKANVKRGPWSPEEDATLKNYVETHGTGGNWIALPQKAGLKRCGKSCRLRWLNYLRPDIKHGGFTEEEDNIICTLYSQMGSRWSLIASQLAGRTDNDVKNYWNTKLKKKLLAGKSSFTLIPAAANNTGINVVPSAQTGSPAATGLQPNLLPKAEPYSTSESHSHINIPAAAAALLPVNLCDGGYGFSVNSSTPQNLLPLDQVIHFSHPEKVTHLSQSGASATNLENSLNINVTNSSQEGSSSISDSTSLGMESNILMDHFSYDFPYEFINGSNYIWSSSQDQKAGEEIGTVPSCYDSLAGFSHADNMKPQGLNQSVANQY